MNTFSSLPKAVLIAIPALIFAGALPSILPYNHSSSAYAQVTGPQDPAKQLAAIKIALDKATKATAARIADTITGRGYSVISIQPGKSTGHRRLMAIRAAKLEALRDLAEQIHGIQINSKTSMAEAIIQNDSLQSNVDGAIRGARTVKIEPMGSDVYEVVLEIDRDTIARIVRSAKGWF
ncbi:MAG: LPP20 family lipoprotein [Paracoccaceae bacterium]|jgi:hypothetical protein